MNLFNNFANSNEEYINRSDIKENLDDVYKKLCSYMFHQLFFYFKYLNNNGDTELITLYMIFCSDYMDFSNYHCPSENGMFYNCQCTHI